MIIGININMAGEEMFKNSHSITIKQLIQVLTLVTALMVSCLVSANERHFTYTYETATLPAGAIELEPWVTMRMFRDDYYVRFDQRLEFEVGITDTVQSALYLNMSGIAAEQGDQLSKVFKYRGMAWETKWKLQDPVADPVGVGLYFELGLQPHELELETKLLLDKRIGKFLFAFNLVGEIEAERDNGEFEKKTVLELDFGLAYFLTPQFTLGIEIRNLNELKGFDTYEQSVIYAGLTMSYAAKRWWLALTVLPQVASFGGDNDELLELQGHERLETRLILGMHL